MAIVSPLPLAEERLMPYAVAIWAGVSAVDTGAWFVTLLTMPVPLCDPPSSAASVARFGVMIVSVPATESIRRDSSDSRKSPGRRARRSGKTDGRRCPIRCMVSLLLRINDDDASAEWRGCQPPGGATARRRAGRRRPPVTRRGSTSPVAGTVWRRKNCLLRAIEGCEIFDRNRARHGRWRRRARPRGGSAGGAQWHPPPPTPWPPPVTREKYG